MRFLCTSNLHVGRATYGVPARLGLDTARISMSAVWDALVDAARAESVDAVILAGDLIDHENRRFEPMGPINRGLATLARHNIPLIAVAGDEDVEALRQLADSAGSEALRLLGRDGSWETTTIPGADGASLTVAGWSAPGRTVSGSPAAHLQDAIGDREPDVVVLHGTPDDRNGGFAPVPVARMTDSHASLWITGAPSIPSARTQVGTTVLAPGSAAALSPIDTGMRGAWIVDTGDGNPTLRQLPLAPVRFDQVDVDLTGCDDTEASEHRIMGALQSCLAAAVAADTGDNLAAVCAHLTVAGHTPAYASLAQQLGEISSTADLHQRGVVLAVTGTTSNARPMIDLGPLTGRADPVGETARILQALEADEEDMPAPFQELLRQTTTRLSAVHRSRIFAAAAGDSEPGPDAARAMLRREAWATLDALVRQRGIDQEGIPPR